ncbi:MAG: hypothetical protein Q9227_009005 [Pyrenula ochraceoflavens]
MTRDQTGVSRPDPVPEGRNPSDWERKQRLKEYRIAANREKRNRKSDEKKQRALNAQILRRMTRNPTKYNKNAGRNKLRAIEMERRKIQANAVRMVQRVAAVHDPSGKTFNVEPVTLLEDGCVITLRALERRREKAEQKAEKAAAEEAAKAEIEAEARQHTAEQKPDLVQIAETGVHYVPQDQLKKLVQAKLQKPRKGPVSKAQQRKQALNEPRPPPPKPTVPEGIELPDDEEENWLGMWDLPDDDLDRRVVRAKRRAQRERKDLRVRQKAGKAERRAARDEKRRVYRDLKQSWKTIREEERKRRKFLQAMEDEEGKRLAIAVNRAHRRRALDCAAQLGFTLDNVEGVEDIKPKALGMKGVEVDWNNLEITDGPSGLKLVDEDSSLKKPVQPAKGKRNSNRVNLGAIASESRTKSVFADTNAKSANHHQPGFEGDFVQFTSTDAGSYEPANLNHKLRRKLRRALEAVQIQKETLVRQRAIQHCEENKIPVPPALTTPPKPINNRGARCMPDGTLETGKQERVTWRVELAEFNKWAKILRKQAKEMSIEAGIRVYLELMGRIPRRAEAGERTEEESERYRREDEGRPMTAAEFLASWQVEGMEDDEGRFGERVGEDGSDVDMDMDVEMGGMGDGEDLDSPSRQLKMDIRRSVSKDRDSDDDSDDDEGPGIGGSETDSDLDSDASKSEDDDDEDEDEESDASP